VYPSTPWNYGLVLGALKPTSISVVRKPWPADGRPFRWDASPIELVAEAKKIPGWKKDYLGLVGRLQPSPIKSSEPSEKISLIPMGCARLRISSFPTVSNGPDSHEWPAPKEPLPTSASFINGFDPIGALSDGILPASSGDQSIPRFTWWDHNGTAEWVQYDFPEARTLTSAAVYWFDDTGSGRCRVPESWKLSYLDRDKWRDVPGASAYGVEPDRFNEVTFGRISTTKLRLEVKLRDGFSGGILEWQIK